MNHDIQNVCTGHCLSTIMRVNSGFIASNFTGPLFQGKHEMLINITQIYL